MSSDDGNGKNGKLDWRPVLLSVTLVIGQGLVQWGITSATLTEHSRRIELIEKRMEERSVAREEYERRHSDLQEQVRELKVLVEENRKEIEAVRRR